MDKVNIQQKLSLFTDHWSPQIVGELNSQHVKLVKFKGEFVWHKHDNEDELFYVVKGSFNMEYRDKTITVNENDFVMATFSSFIYRRLPAPFCGIIYPPQCCSLKLHLVFDELSL